MGRHVNHQDAQDRIMSKFSKTAKQQCLEERDPDSLSLAEQIDLEAKRRKAKQNEIKPEVKKIEVTRFSRKK